MVEITLHTTTRPYIVSRNVFFDILSLIVTKRSVELHSAHSKIHRRRYIQCVNAPDEGVKERSGEHHITFTNAPPVLVPRHHHSEMVSSPSAPRSSMLYVSFHIILDHDWRRNYALVDINHRIVTSQHLQPRSGRSQRTSRWPLR